MLITGLVVLAVTVGRSPAAFAAQPAVGLGTATSFAVLAGTTVTNTGPTMVSGDVGVSPGTAVTGFPPGQVSSGVIHAADAVALQAQDDLTTAYDDAAGRSPVVDKTDDDLGGETLVAGVYHANTGLSLTGTVTLDGQGDPSAVFIFQAGSTLLTATGSRVALQGGAQACNVFWQVGSSATIATSTRFVGTVMALSSITMQTQATIRGRLLARNGQVSLDTNTISRPACATAPTTTPPTASTTIPTGTSTATATVTPTGTTSATATGTTGTSTPTSTLPTSTNPTGTAGGPGGPGGGPGGPDHPGKNPPWVPHGHPPTGQGPAQPDPSATGLWLGGGLLVAGAACGAAAARRP
ncbi:ice-binding family protein, partial [Nocardioides pelophilus]|uniref:ice-binding family protein n=1 Tax=Nocardioides pelophilus TaxID=2172019 RepID=UPI001C81F331